MSRVKHSSSGLKNKMPSPGCRSKHLEQLAWLTLIISLQGNQIKLSLFSR